jgi:ATP-dependent Clp protease ATP-binding subunit ClpA
VTVEKGESGETGLKLQSLADEVPVKPKKEEPRRDSAPRKPSSRKAAAKKPAAQSSRDGSGSKDGGKRSLVPQLPRKN